MLYIQHYGQAHLSFKQHTPKLEKMQRPVQAIVNTNHQFYILYEGKTLEQAHCIYMVSQSFPRIKACELLIRSIKLENMFCLINKVRAKHYTEFHHFNSSYTAMAKQNPPQNKMIYILTRTIIHHVLQFQIFYKFAGLVGHILLLG